MPGPGIEHGPFSGEARDLTTRPLCLRDGGYNNIPVKKNCQNDKGQRVNTPKNASFYYERKILVHVSSTSQPHSGLSVRLGGCCPLLDLTRNWP